MDLKGSDQRELRGIGKFADVSSCSRTMVLDILYISSHRAELSISIGPLKFSQRVVSVTLNHLQFVILNTNMYIALHLLAFGNPLDYTVN